MLECSPTFDGTGPALYLFCERDCLRLQNRGAVRQCYCRRPYGACCPVLVPASRALEECPISHSAHGLTVPVACEDAVCKIPPFNCSDQDVRAVVSSWIDRYAASEACDSFEGSLALL